LGANSLKKSGYFAGTDSERLSDLIDALSDKNVKAIICTRGGYGTVRLLNLFPWDMFANSEPKVFVGFSDISALMLTFWEKYGWQSYFGLQVANGLSGSYSERSLAHFRSVLGADRYPISWLDGNDMLLNSDEGKYCEGHLIPCCLSILTSLIGTSFSPDLSDTILCIEDLNEPTYKYDRMLVQLRMSGMMDKINGLILGKFFYKDSDISGKIACIASEIFKDYNFPIWRGIPFGHYNDRLTLPIGVKMKVSAEGKLSTIADISAEY